jgi:hypothetical protein
MKNKIVIIAVLAITCGSYFGYQHYKDQEIKIQLLRSQELRSQELRAQELRAQELRAQELRAQELRAQELRAQELRAQENEAQKPTVKIFQLESLKINEGLITDEIAKRFDPRADQLDAKLLNIQVEQRISGMFTTALAQGLSSTKLVQLAVREDSLKALQKEWQVAGELGVQSGAASPEIGIKAAAYIVNARIENIVTERRVLGKEVAAIWKNEITASLEITSVAATGGKKTITETVTDEGKGRMGVGNKAADFDAAQMRGLMEKLTKKLATRILDNYSPPRVTAIRGRQMIIDRGIAAGVKVGDKFQLIEKVADNQGTDAGFPLGEASVKSISEDTSNLDFDPSLITDVKKESLTIKRVP